MIIVKIMNTAVRLSESLIEIAKKYASNNLRSIPKQIEYWSMLGRIAEDNPDLPMSFIKEVLMGLNEIESGNISEFEFRN